MDVIVEIPEPRDVKITFKDKKDVKEVVKELIDKNLEFTFKVGLDEDIFWVWMLKDDLNDHPDLAFFLTTKKNRRTCHEH